MWEKSPSPPKKKLPLDGTHGNSCHLNMLQFMKGNESNSLVRGEVSGKSPGLWRIAYGEGSRGLCTWQEQPK